MEGEVEAAKLGLGEKKKKTQRKKVKKYIYISEKGKRRASADVRIGCPTRDWTNYHSRAALFSHTQPGVTVAV